MKRLAAILVAVVTLSACAVTGQPARPGTAATYDGATITTDQVAAWGTAQTQMGLEHGFAPGAVLTLLLLRPALEAEAAKEGIAFPDDQISIEAKLWMASYGQKATEPTTDMTDVVRTVRLANALLLTDDGKAAIAKAVRSIEADATVSPLYGPFTVADFAASIDAAAAQEQTDASKLGDVSYLVYRELTGFNVDAKREWMGSSAAPSPSPSASPAG